MATAKPLVHIYTDGGCSPNPGLGAWAAILISPAQNHRKEISGVHPSTTNNRMELTAALAALQALKFPCKVVVYTDSKYLHNAFEAGWIEKWQQNSWKTRNKTPVCNVDLWQQLIELCKTHDVTWKWVKGHAAHPENERADELVRLTREQHGKPAKEG